MKKESLIICLILGLCFSIKLSAQQTKSSSNWTNAMEIVNFDNRVGYSFFPRSKTDLPNYKLPRNISDNYSVANMIFQGDQYIYAQYKEGKISKEALLSRYEGIDTTLLIDKPIKNYLSTLVYKDSLCKYLIFDLNYNKDFSDDQLYTFKLADIEQVSKLEQHKFVIKLEMPLEYALNGKVFSTKAITYVLPFVPASLRLTQSDELYYHYSVPTKVSVCRYNDITFFINKSLPDTAKYYTINLLGDDGKRLDKNYAVKDKFSFRGQTYIIDSLDLIANKIKILPITEAVTKGTEVNFYFDQKIIGKNQYQKPISVKGYEGKYLLIDLWATWCAPCIESVPMLKAIKEKYKDSKFAMLSISIDKENDLRKVKAFVKEHGMNWDVMMPNLSNTKELTAFIGVPYFILLSPKGEILFSKSGTGSLPNLTQKLNALFKY